MAMKTKTVPLFLRTMQTMSQRVLYKIAVVKCAHINTVYAEVLMALAAFLQMYKQHIKLILYESACSCLGSSNIIKLPTQSKQETCCSSLNNVNTFFCDKIGCHIGFLGPHQDSSQSPSIFLHLR